MTARQSGRELPRGGEGRQHLSVFGQIEHLKPVDNDRLRNFPRSCAESTPAKRSISAPACRAPESAERSRAGIELGFSESENVCRSGGKFLFRQIVERSAVRPMTLTSTPPQRPTYAECQELETFDAGSSSNLESGPVVKKKTEPALSAATGSALCRQVVGSRTVVDEMGLGPVGPPPDIPAQLNSGRASVSFTVPELFRIASPDRVDATMFPLGVMAIGASRLSAVGVWFCALAAAAGFPRGVLDVAVTRASSPPAATTDWPSGARNSA